jgi:hypothetical protein
VRKREKGTACIVRVCREDKIMPENSGKTATAAAVFFSVFFWGKSICSPCLLPEEDQSCVPLVRV